MRRDRLLTTGASLGGAELLVMSRAQGVFVWDAAGRRYLDGLSGYWCAPLGYGRRDVVARVAAQLRLLSYAPLDWRAHPPALALAEALLSRAPRNLSRAYFCSGGSEGVEAALKIARLYACERGEPERTVVVSRRGSYHGAAYGATSVSGFPELKRGVGALLPDVAQVDPPDCARCPFGLKAGSCALECAGAVEEAFTRLGGRAAAFIAEPVCAAGRVQVPPEGYWPRVAAAVRAAGALLILDEVLTGLGRTGTWFAAAHWGLEPDLLVLGKGLSGGYAPLGAVLVSETVAEAFRRRPLEHGYTFQGHPAACAAGLATLEGLEAVLPAAEGNGRVLRRELERRGAKPVSGLGLLVSVALGLDDAARGRLRRRLLEEGLLCGVEADALQLAPALTASPRQLKDIAAAAARALL